MSFSDGVGEYVRFVGSSVVPTIVFPCLQCQQSDVEEVPWKEEDDTTVFCAGVD